MSSMSMENAPRFSQIKPTADTPFSIDFEWWEKQNRNWKVMLRDQLCDEHQKAFSSVDDDSQIDWIDPETAEIKLVDGIQQAFLSHCSKLPGFLQNLPLVDAIFFTLIANGNRPLSANQLSERINTPAQRILLVIGGNIVQRGIRPQH